MRGQLRGGFKLWSKLSRGGRVGWVVPLGSAPASVKIWFYFFKTGSKRKSEPSAVFQRSYKWEQTNWISEQFGNFWKWKGAKLGITMPPCGHTMQVKDKTCSFNVIFYFEIIIIKSLSTVHACVPSMWPGQGRPEFTCRSRDGHVTVNGPARGDPSFQSVSLRGRGLFNEADQ